MSDTVRGLTDQAWARVLERDPVAAQRAGQVIESLPVSGPSTMEHDVTQARAALKRLAAIAIPPAEELEAEFLRDHLTHEVAEAERFWYRFPVTPYNTFNLGAYRSEILGVGQLESKVDADRYLSLVHDYAAVIEQIGATLDEQRGRGIRLPGWAVPEAVSTMQGHRDASVDLMMQPEQRDNALGPGPARRLTDGITAVVEGRLAAAFARIFDGLSTDATAPENPRQGVGIGQFDGGESCYAGLIRLQTGLDLTAERVHTIGLAEVDRITERIRDELGIRDEQAFRHGLAGDPRSYAQSSADLETIFQGHLDRLTPHLGRYFHRLPAAPFRLRPLDAALDGLTYGYYESPARDGVGYYHYNAANLAERPLVQAASVIYHEGLPGHHLQIGRQLENTALHPIRRESTELRTFALNGYLEGWAEYAAGLADELGLYTDPFDRYGRLSSERFLAARLVVDTGLNVLGWSRRRSADYLKTNGFMSDGEISSELLRYALDDPAQALGYHLGHWYLRELRAEHGLDPRDFHEAVVANGPLPLELLARHLRRSGGPPPGDANRAG